MNLQTSVEDVEKREALCTVDGLANHCSHCRKEYRCFSKKLKIELPYDPAIPLWVYISKEIQNTNLKRFMHPYVHYSVIYKIAEIWKQPKCPSIDDCIRKMWYIYITRYYSAIKKIKSYHLLQYG